MKSVLLGTFILITSIANLAFAEAPKELILSKDNVILLSGEVNDASAASVIQQARKLDASLQSGYPIILVLDTPGGSIQSGLEIIEVLKSLNRPVNTLTIFAASMGFQIAQNLGQRYIISSGVLMSHKAFGSFRGEFGDGLSQIDSRYGFWVRRIKQLDEKTVSRTKGKQTLQSYRTAYENELWLTGEDSVSQGYADSAVNARCDSTLNGQRVENISFFGLKITLKFSACPLNSYPEEVVININTNKGQMPLEDFLAKGGVFGPCKEVKKDKEDEYFNRYSSLTPGPVAVDTAAPCPSDTTLTMEQIEKKSAEVKLRHSPSEKRSSIKTYW